MARKLRDIAFLVLLIAVMAVCVLRLEHLRAVSAREVLDLGGTPATLYRGGAEGLVIVSHGFAGSRQMMEAISLTLARAGHNVVAFDYRGHGRNDMPLSRDVQRISGTTEDLVRQTVAVAREAQALTGDDRISLVGHSMATDVIVRAAERLEGVDGVAAISMYSEAVTAEHPERLLIVSGARETRLRAAARDAMAQIGGRMEGETVSAQNVERRAVSIPHVGHVGVLWSETTSEEIADWIGPGAEAIPSGPWIAVLLVAIVIATRPVSALLMPPPAALPTTGVRRAALASVAGGCAACAGAATALPALGLAAVGALALGFGTWGAAILLVIRPFLRASLKDVAGALFLLLWGLGAFALALDRYGAAFLPTGPRLAVTALILPGALLFGLADRALVQGRGLAARVSLRVPLFLGLAAAIALRPDPMGLVFTVLPVLALYLVVFGTMARCTAERTGPVGAGLASGIILAWSLAASTPLFAAG